MLAALLHPQSVAVVGVSTDPLKVGHQVFVNLLKYKKPVYPINPGHSHILGKPCFPNLLAIPHHVDLVVIATPMSTVEAITDECIDKQVKAVIIITAGFAETSSQGRAVQDRIAEKLAFHKIELLGPNTLGLANPHIDLNASFAPAHIAKGHIALISQSGAMLTTIFAEFASRGVGCSFALSLGNKAGVTENEALEYALEDPNTHLIALYLESVSDTRRFLSLCKKITKTKPILLLKGGMSDEGQKASLSHTAALATNKVLLKEASYQMGYTMVDTIEQFFETAFFVEKLRSFPNNLMILTNAGGPAVNATDLASNTGIPLATWSKESLERFARELPRVHPANPTDLIGDASVQDIETGLLFANEDPGIESLILIITPQAVTDIPGITKMLIEHHKPHQKPLVVALMGGEDQHRYVVELREAGLIVTEYSNEAVEIYTYVDHIRRAQLIDRSNALMKQLEQALEAPGTVRGGNRVQFPVQHAELEDAYLLLENYGFTLPRCAIADSASQVREMDGLDSSKVFPLIAKTANLGLKHKAVVGAIVKDIHSTSDALKAYNQLKKFSNRVVYQEVITNAAEVIMGGKRDQQFGPFIAVGMGGSLTNVLADRSYIFLPASLKEIRMALRRTKLFTTLSNEQQQLVLISLERFARIFKDHPEIQELEINPLMVTKDAAYVADVKLTMDKQ